MNRQPCINSEDDFTGWDEPPTFRHAWQGTGLDVLEDTLVHTRRCVWCELAQHATYVRPGTRPKAWRNTPSEDHEAVVLEPAGTRASQ